MRNARPTKVKASALDQRIDSTASDLFPDTLPGVFLPTFPTPGSVREAALLALVAGSIRQSGFARSWRLAAYVRFLRDDGWAIRRQDVAEGGRIVAEYALDLQDAPTRTAASRYRRGAI